MSEKEQPSEDETRPLTERQQMIFGLMVRSYIADGAPTGSKTLVERYLLDMSPATVRNELSALDELGYLAQLHTSAGRIPTEKGYRYFVQHLMGQIQLPHEQQKMISHQFHQARLELEQWMQLSAAILARASHGASFITPPRPPVNRFKHVQLIATQGRLVLLVLVLFGGEVQQQMLTLAEPVSQAHLTNLAQRLNERFELADAAMIRTYLPHLDSLAADVAQLVLDIVTRADGRAIHNVYRDGLANIMDDEGTRQAVRVLEERALLAHVLSETLSPDTTGVQVVIGGEGRWHELKECAIILSSYGVVGELTGSLAVVGPTRMAYGHNISAVRYVASLMSGFVYEYYNE